MSYLPLAHIAERMFSLYLAVCNGGHVHFCHERQASWSAPSAQVKPTAFFGVPRVWEKVQAGIQALLAAEQDEGRRAAVAAAMDTGRRYVAELPVRPDAPRRAGRRVRAGRRAACCGRSGPCSGWATRRSWSAPRRRCRPRSAAFFAGLGMKILDMYGMTETTGAFTTNTPRRRSSSARWAGRCRAWRCRIAEDGEILARGPLNTPGYLNLPDLTAELIDADGWLHTGDIGRLDDDGFVSVMDRKKELIITSGGENMSPAAIENLLVAHPLVGQALAYGDRRPYVVALLTLDGEVAPAWAQARGIEAGSLAELAEHPAVLAAVGEAVAAANEQLARVQQVKRWRLLPVEWTAESEELTPTLKLKRRVVHAKYADDIDTLYAG